MCRYSITSCLSYWSQKHLRLQNINNNIFIHHIKNINQMFMYKRVWQKIFAILAENQLVQNTESLPEKNLYLVAIWQELSCLLLRVRQKISCLLLDYIAKIFFQLFHNINFLLSRVWETIYFLLLRVMLSVNFLLLRVRM